MLDLHIIVSHLFDTNELIETELLVLHLLLIELLNTCCINLCSRGLAKLKDLLILFLLGFEFGHDEGKLGKFRLSLFFDRCTHSFEYSRLMKCISVDLVARSLVFLLLWMVVGVDISMELPDVDAIILCR